MRIENLPLLCNPYVGEPFKIEKGFLVGVMTGKKIPHHQWYPSDLRCQ